MNALADEDVGKFLNRYFISSFQKVGTFRINNQQKQGGNVASYFCSPDGRVLHVIAGPVDAKVLQEEARWVVDTTHALLTKSKGDGTRFKELMRQAHAERLMAKHGVRVSAVFQDEALQNRATALAYRDAAGRRLAPVLPLPPIENPREVRTNLTNAAQVERLMAAHALMKIEGLYGAVFEGILGEKISTQPVQADTPFPRRN